MNRTLKGISYVSVWVLIWGFAGSLIDLPLGSDTITLNIQNFVFTLILVIHKETTL